MWHVKHDMSLAVSCSFISLCGVVSSNDRASAWQCKHSQLNIVGKETKQKSDEVLLKVIAEGAGKMPANKKFSKEEQKAVLQYSRSLAN